MLSLGNLFIGVRSRRVADAVAGLCMPAFQAIREANRRSNCVGNLHRITLAMLIYEREHGTLPPAYTVDADGNPLHSWRVLLLPYLGEEELYGKLRLDEPWDSEHNRQFHDAALAIYQCPSAELAPGQTTYSVVVGENTAFQAGEGKSLDDFGMNLILVVEREQPVCWMDPTSELAESIAFEGNQSPGGRRRRDREPSSGWGERRPSQRQCAVHLGDDRAVPCCRACSTARRRIGISSGPSAIPREKLRLPRGCVHPGFSSDLTVHRHATMICPGTTTHDAIGWP